MTVNFTQNKGMLFLSKAGQDLSVPTECGYKSKLGLKFVDHSGRVIAVNENSDSDETEREFHDWSWEAWTRHARQMEQAIDLHLVTLSSEISQDQHFVSYH